MPETLKFTEAQKSAFRTELAPKATDSQWALFIDEAERRGLIPGTHVLFNVRAQSEYDATLQDWVQTKKVAFMTTINALRLIAKRDGHYLGRTPFIFYYKNESGKLESTEIPEGTIPHAVSASFFRNGWKEALKVVARFDAFAQRTKKGELTSMWAKRSEEQLAKCCEAAGLREVAPEECGGLYIKEELEGQDEVPAVEKSAPTTSLVPPSAFVAPAVNQNAAPSPDPEPSLQEMHDSLPEEIKQKISDAADKLGYAPSVRKADSTSPAEGGTGVSPEAMQAAMEAFSATAVAADITEVKKEDDRIPNTNEFGAFTARASNLIRITLPKAGIKNAADAFKSYTARVSGQGKALNTKKLTVGQWETILSTVEKAAADQVAKIVKG